MDFDFDMDGKKGTNRYDAMFADLASQIDNLPDDGEDDGEPLPQYNQPKNTSKAGKPGASGFGGGSGKKGVVDTGDDLEFAIKNMKRGHDDEDDDEDFRKFEEVKIDRGKAGQKNPLGSRAEDLEAMINGLQSDGEDNDEPQVKKPNTMVSKPASSNATTSKPISSNVTQTQPQGTSKSQISSQPVSVQKTNLNSSEADAVPFPLSCYLNVPAELAIKLEDKLHPTTAMFSFKVMDYEINKILEPCINNAKIDKEIRARLGRKKIDLEKQRQRFEENLQSKKLNVKTFPPIMEKSLEDNKKLLDLVTKGNGRKADVQRIQLRVKILQDDIANWRSKIDNLPSNIKTSKAGLNSSQKAEKPQPTISNTKNANPDNPLKDYQKMNKHEQLRCLKARKAQHYNIAMFLKKEIVPFLPKNESEKVVKRIKEKYLPLLQKANDIIKAMEEGTEDDVSDFLSEEFNEITPEELHGMTLSERSQVIKDIISKMEAAKADEANYSQMLANSTDKASSSHAIQSKIKDTKRRIDDYDKQAELLSKIDKEPWIYTPRASFASETRTVQMVNPEIPDLNTLVIEFPRVTRCAEKTYFLKYSIHANGKVQQFTTNKSTKDGVWNYANKVALTADPKVADRELHMKEIHIQIYGTGVFSDSKKGEDRISLKDFQKTNTLRGKILLSPQENKYEVEYVLKIREPLLKTAKINVSSVIIEKVFPKVDINAKLPETTNQPSPNTSQTKTQQDTQKSQQQPQQQAQPNEAVSFSLVIAKSNMSSLKDIDQSQLPAGFTLEDVMEPDDPTKNKSYTYLQELSKQLEAAKTQMMGGFGNVADSKYVRDKWSLAYKEFNVLESRLSAGQIDMQDYMKGLEDTVERDKKLLQFYTAKEVSFYINFIKAKIDVYEKELSEMKAQMAESQE